MKPSELARKAIDVLDERGWTQGSYNNEDGCCAVGALGLAANALPDDIRHSHYMTVRNELYREVSTSVPDGADVGADVIDWNDEPGRTADEVKALFRRAADRLEAEGK